MDGYAYVLPTAYVICECTLYSIRNVVIRRFQFYSNVHNNNLRIQENLQKRIAKFLFLFRELTKSLKCDLLRILSKYILFTALSKMYYYTILNRQNLIHIVLSEREIYALCCHACVSCVSHMMLRMDCIHIIQNR